MEEVMQPTVGRIVLFRADENNTFPSIVTRVHEGTNVNGIPLINLQVFRDFGVEAMTSIYHGENVGQWSWMPFQKDQQKRVAAMADAEVEKRTGGASIVEESK